jgi:hypothetical protein
MKHYYYSDNNQQLGPFTLEELKNKRLKKSTLVWTDGLQDWTSADKLDELKAFVISEPPPLPNKRTNEPENSVKIKLTSTSISNDYTKESEATFIGVVLLLTPIIIKLSGALNFDTEESYNQGRAFIAIGSLVIRIFVTVWVVSIANRQNRNSNGWGWFAFFFPSISLIVIGQLNKLPLKINIDSSLSTDEQITILKTKADDLKRDLRLNEALSVLIKIKDLNSDYPAIEEEIENCKSKIDSIKNNRNNRQEKAKPENVLYNYDTSKGKLEIEQNHNSYPDINPGKKALLNGVQAPTGKYKLGFMWYVHIENGIVRKISTL